MRNEKGQFVKGHLGYGKGVGWKNDIRKCKCGKLFNPRKKFSLSCSQHCAMIGTKRRLGIPMSEETRAKVAKTWFKKGIQSSPETCFKKGHHAGLGKKNPNNSGPKHHNWKGGITPINEKIRRTIEYKEWRRAVFTRDNWTCVLCHKNGGDLHADHIKPFSTYPELRFIIDNGRTLCVPCHRNTNTYGYNAIKSRQ